MSSRRRAAAPALSGGRPRRRSGCRNGRAGESGPPGRGAMIGVTLGWLNGAQVIGSFMMLFMTERLQRGTWPFTIFGPLTLAGLLGIVLCDGVWVVVSAAAAGLGAAVTFIVTFGLPAISSPPGE